MRIPPTGGADPGKRENGEPVGRRRSLPGMNFHCDLCERTMKRGTTAHHLIPRTCHSNKWFKRRYSREEMRQTVDLCADCHRAIHRHVPREKDLGRHFNTLNLLREHPSLSRYLAWIRKQK